MKMFALFDLVVAQVRSVLHERLDVIHLDALFRCDQTELSDGSFENADLIAIEGDVVDD